MVCQVVEDLEDDMDEMTIIFNDLPRIHFRVILIKFISL
jgi:hypothetical protein